MSRLGATTSRFAVAGAVVLAIIVGVVALLRYDSTGSTGSGLSSPFVYDIGEMAKIDPNLIMYQSEGSPFATGLAESRHILVDPNGVIYTTGDKAIRRFSRTGRLLDEIRLNGEPRPVAIDNLGRIYVGLRDHIEVYDAKGERLTVWDSLGERALLTSIAIEENDVFVADAGNRIVLHYDTDGALIGRIGEKDEERSVPGFIVPNPYFKVAIAPDGLLRVINPGRLRIEAYTYEGDLEFSWGKFSARIEGFCGCCNPVSFAILPDESFVTVEKGLIRAKLYNSNGEFVGVVAGPEQLGVEGAMKIFYMPDQNQAGGFDIAVDVQGRVFILDTIKNMVRVFSRKAEE